MQWVWEAAHQDALQALKRAVAAAPVLRYFNLEEELTLQWDASQFRLGAALLQNELPIAYASRAMSDAETCYAQIEKELSDFARNKITADVGCVHTLIYNAHV